MTKCFGNVEINSNLTETSTDAKMKISFLSKDTSKDIG